MRKIEIMIDNGVKYMLNNYSEDDTISEVDDIVITVGEIKESIKTAYTEAYYQSNKNCSAMRGTLIMENIILMIAGLIYIAQVSINIIL